jgi:hypothetical protein
MHLQFTQQIMQRAVRATLFFFTCSVLLVACGENDGDGTAPGPLPPPVVETPSPSPSPIGTPTPTASPTPTPASSDLKAIAEASLAANVRKAHPHEGNVTNNPGAPSNSTSPSVSPGNAFTQGIPGDDIEQTALYSIGSVTGEAAGFDIFNAVNTADEQPGKGLVVTFYASANKGGADMPGDRFILGDHVRAFYLGRTNDIDYDFARMAQLDSRGGNEIVLHGTPSQYKMVETSGNEKGTAIFFNNNGMYDMIGYIDELIKTDPNDAIYKYTSATPAPLLTAVAANQTDQFGGAGADLITAIEVDATGNLYVTGVSRSNLNGIFPGGGGKGQLFAAKYSSSGQRQWLQQFGSAEQLGDLSWDIAVDNSAVYIAARYIAPENVMNGLKDSAYFKLDVNSGSVLQEKLWDGVGVQYAGAVALDNTQYVYFSGIGMDVDQLNPDGTQDPYIEKRNRSDLSLVKRKMFGGDKDNIAGAGGAQNKEPWGGIKFFPKTAGLPGQGTIYSSGWTQGAYETTQAFGGGDVWLAAFDENLNELWAEGWGSNQRDWAWDLDVDSQGYVYVVGMTLGAMAGSGSHKGLSDGFITKFDPSKPSGQRLVWTKQLGTPRNDELRKIKIIGNKIYISGHTYGDMAKINAGQSDIWVSQLDLNGNVINTLQIGTAEDERAAVTADATSVYIGGYTFGSLVKATKGFIDAFVMRFSHDLKTN